MRPTDAGVNGIERMRQKYMRHELCPAVSMSCLGLWVWVCADSLFAAPEFRTFERDDSLEPSSSGCSG